MTLATGLVPAHHGIVDAAFCALSHAEWVFSDALEDPDEHILGVPDARGKTGVAVRVPLVFMGAGVSHGVSQELAHTTDIAPTLAALAGIPLPEHLDGRPLLKARAVRDGAARGPRYLRAAGEGRGEGSR